MTGCLPSWKSGLLAAYMVQGCPEVCVRGMCCAGVNAVGSALRSAATTASSAAGALAERLRGLLSRPGELVEPQLSEIRESVGQVAVVTGELEHHKVAAVTSCNLQHSHS